MFEDCREVLTEDDAWNIPIDEVNFTWPELVSLGVIEF